MSKVIAMVLMLASSCAFAEDQSLLELFLAAAGGTNAVANAAVQSDAKLAELSQQMKDLKAKIDSIKAMPSEKREAFKKELADLKAKFLAKVEEFKAQQAAAKNEQTKKADETKTQLEQTKQDGKELLNSVKSLFK